MRGPYFKSGDDLVAYLQMADEVLMPVVRLLDAGEDPPRKYHAALAGLLLLQFVRDGIERSELVHLVDSVVALAAATRGRPGPDHAQE